MCFLAFFKEQKIGFKNSQQTEPKRYSFKTPCFIFFTNKKLFYGF